MIDQGEFRPMVELRGSPKFFSKNVGACVGRLALAAERKISG
jgi:hypothetical protein